MEWVIAGVALLIIAVFVFGALRSGRRPRPGTAPSDRRGDGTGAAIATGVTVSGVAATSPDDERVDDGGGGGGDGGS